MLDWWSRIHIKNHFQFATAFGFLCAQCHNHVSVFFHISPFQRQYCHLYQLFWMVRRLRESSKYYLRKTGCGSHSDETCVVVSHYTLMLEFNFTLPDCGISSEQHPKGTSPTRQKPAKQTVNKKMHQMTKVRTDSPDLTNLYFREGERRSRTRKRTKEEEIGGRRSAGETGSHPGLCSCWALPVACRFKSGMRLCLSNTCTTLAKKN